MPKWKMHKLGLQLFISKRFQKIPRKTYHIGNAEQFGGVGGSLDPQTHDVGYRGVEESSLGGGEDGNEDVRPGEREQEGRQAVGSPHQLLVV